ncbi:MAG TPA: DNA-protecting protein DprA [Candidatus Jorgensenbacteria bacterium]|nr:DNA-protecting protein DprA [Candidatus Jorgensenbacteria bacterium]
MEQSIYSVTHKETLYPYLLREITSPPSPLYYRGRLPERSEPLIAIVGTRKATARGKLFAKRLAQELAERRITVVSGLALGIDGAAHEGALLGGGKTIAVLANGLDSIYPREHRELAVRLLEQQGCIVSDYVLGTPPLPNQFLERNRIISGLCVAVVVVEAPARSGALSTARHAADQGRDVFVVPGPAESEYYRGSHALIRDGARLITTASDIFDDLPQLVSILTNRREHL